MANGLFAWRVQKSSTTKKSRIIPTKPSVERDPPLVQAWKTKETKKRKYFGGEEWAGDESESVAEYTDLGRDYKTKKLRREN